MKRTTLFIVTCSIVASILLASCSSGAAHQAWQPKKGKKPKAGQNR